MKFKRSDISINRWGKLRKVTSDGRLIGSYEVTVWLHGAWIQIKVCPSRAAANRFAKSITK